MLACGGRSYLNFKLFVHLFCPVHSAKNLNKKEFFSKCLCSSAVVLPVSNQFYGVDSFESIKLEYVAAQTQEQ